jgi:hypothetical protein
MEKEKNLEKIIEEMTILVKEKRIAIHSQQYGKAARLRDEEKVLETKLYNKVFGKDTYEPVIENPFVSYDHYRKSTWKDLEYFFKEKFDVGYPLSESDSISVIRQIKLKKLGI